MSRLMLLGCNVKQPLGVLYVVTRKNQRAAADSTVAAQVCEVALRVLLASLTGCFTRIEPRRKVASYLRALMSDLAKRNGWTISEWIGDREPSAVQRLLNRAVWDHDRAMSLVRRFAVGVSGVVLCHERRQGFQERDRCEPRRAGGR